jgi:hypothetical protein
MTEQDDGTYDFAGHPEATSAVAQWIAAHPGSTAGYPSCTGDLVSVFTVPTDVGASSSYDAATFDLNTGQRVRLSDLFYDGVNYIDFINANLVNQWTNQALQGQVDSSFYKDPDYFVTTPFTGIPSDYSSFALSLTTTGTKVTVAFPAGNPFLATISAAAPDMLPLNLPANLSPYGALWRLDQPSAPGKPMVALPSVTTDFPGPGPHDAAINSAIEQTYAQAPGAQSTEIDLDGTRLTVAFWDQAFATYWQPGTILTMTTVDLGTGQPAPYTSADIPDQWWTAGYVNVFDVEASTQIGFPQAVDGYVPPAGSVYRDVRVGQDGVKFDLVEPSGRVLRCSVYPA